MMRAELVPLGDKKYYGTEVAIKLKEGQSGIVNIWIGGNWKPSRRELEGYVLKDGVWKLYDSELNEWFEYEISDGHFESETSLKIAELLVEAINSDNA